jgi:hypothetical protein
MEPLYCNSVSISVLLWYLGTARFAQYIDVPKVYGKLTRVHMTAANSSALPAEIFIALVSPLLYMLDRIYPAMKAPYVFCLKN